MNILTFDIECTHKLKPNGKHTRLPYFGNERGSIGYKVCQEGREDFDNYLCFMHDEEPPTKYGFAKFQYVLDRADVVVGHNIKFDLNWIRECGFKYEGKVYDTMVAEYVLIR